MCMHTSKNETAGGKKKANSISTRLVSDRRSPVYCLKSVWEALGDGILDDFSVRRRNGGNRRFVEKSREMRSHSQQVSKLKFLSEPRRTRAYGTKAAEQLRAPAAVAPRQQPVEDENFLMELCSDIYRQGLELGSELVGLLNLCLILILILRETLSKFWWC